MANRHMVWDWDMIKKTAPLHHWKAVLDINDKTCSCPVSTKIHLQFDDDMMMM